MVSLEDNHNRWKQCKHDKYAQGIQRSAFLAGLIDEHIKHFPVEYYDEARILEVGCNIGRNLDYLRSQGFQCLNGIEINKNTAVHSRRHYPELWNMFESDMGESTGIIYDSIEEYLSNPKYREMGCQNFDVVYTMAVMEHIHPESEWVFAEMVKLLSPAGVLITIEDELNVDYLDFVFPRNYKAIFESCGLEQVDVLDSGNIPGLKEGYFTRVFKHPDS